MWIWNAIKQIWEWILGAASASPMIYLTVITRTNAANKNAGDISSVSSVAPTELSLRQFLCIETDLPESEAMALTKSGVPDSVVKALNDEVALALKEGRKPDNKYSYLDSDYPYRAKRLDLTALPQDAQDEIPVVDNNWTELAALAPDAKDAAKTEVIKEVEKQYGRTLTTAEKSKSTMDFIKEVTSDTPDADLDAKKQAIIGASKRGWDSVEKDILSGVTAPQVVYVSASDLRKAIVDNA